MKIIHINDSLKNRASWVKMQSLTEKLKADGIKFLAGECHKLNRFYIIIW